MGISHGIRCREVGILCFVSLVADRRKLGPQQALFRQEPLAFEVQVQKWKGLG